MICVAISSKDTNSAIKKSQAAIQKGADLIEIRIDHFRDPFSADLVYLMKAIDSKLVLTVRKPAEGGQFAFEEDERLDLIQRCIDVKPYAVDLEFSISGDKLTQLIHQAQENHVKTILSFHDFKKTPAITLMKAKIVEAKKRGADFVKIIGTAQSVADNLTMLSLPQFAKENGIQIIAFALGQKGTVSRIPSPLF